MCQRDGLDQLNGYLARQEPDTLDKPGGLMKGCLDNLSGVSLLTSMATPTILYRKVFGGPNHSRNEWATPRLRIPVGDASRSSSPGRPRVHPPRCSGLTHCSRSAYTSSLAQPAKKVRSPESSPAGSGISWSSKRSMVRIIWASTPSSNPASSACACSIMASVPKRWASM